MNLCYYTEGIRDELDGACSYTDKAICCKKEHPEWAMMYYKMGDAELEHASNLLKIFEDDWKASKSDDPIYDEIHDSILKMYSDQVAIIRVKQQSYSSSK